MRIDVHEGGDSWLKIYADLATHQSHLEFDRTPEWFSTYVQDVVGGADNSMMVTITDEVTNQSLLGMPVLSGVSGRLQSRYLRALSNYYSALYCPIMSGDDNARRRSISGLVSALGANTLAWDVLSLEPLAEEGFFLKEFCKALEVANIRYQVTSHFVNWYLMVGGRSYETYEKSLPSKLKNTLSRKEKKLGRERGYTIRIAEDVSELEGFIADYETVYQQSWKPEESHPQFIRAIIRRFAEKGWLRLGIMYINDEPVASQLWFVKEGVASIYKLAYDEQYMPYSVGTILTANMMKQVIDVDGVEVIDFLTGNDAYKREWMSHQRERCQITVFNNKTLRGKVLSLWNIDIKQMLRRLRPS